ENRSIDGSAIKKLVAKFGSGLDRMNQRHHMSITIKPENLNKLLSALGTTLTQLREQSDQQEYVLITDEVWDKYGGKRFVLQAGQHRFAALQQVMVNPVDRWWPARLY